MLFGFYPLIDLHSKVFYFSVCENSSILVGSHIPPAPMYGPKCMEAIEYACNHLGIDLYKQPSKVSMIKMGPNGRLIIPDQKDQANNYNPHYCPFNNITNQPFAGNIGRALLNKKFIGRTTEFSPRIFGSKYIKNFFLDLLEHKSPAIYAKFMDNGGSRTNPN